MLFTCFFYCLDAADLKFLLDSNIFWSSSACKYEVCNDTFGSKLLYILMMNVAIQSTLWMRYQNVLREKMWRSNMSCGQMQGTALVEIIMLWSAVAATMYLFWPVNTLATYLLVPYLGWCVFLFLNSSFNSDFVCEQ